MRYRVLSPTGDYTFGQGPGEFLVNSPAAVAQAIGTRLRLWLGEWFLDLTVGVPWITQVVGTGTSGIRDMVIRTAILNTEGVLSIVSYSSSLDTENRLFSVNATVGTVYGPVILSETVPITPFELDLSLLDGTDAL